MNYFAKELAETTAEIHRKMSEIQEVTGWEIYETFPDIDRYYYLFINMVGGTFDDYSFDRYYDYLSGKIDYPTLLIGVRATEVSE